MSTPKFLSFPDVDSIIAPLSYYKIIYPVPRLAGIPVHIKEQNTSLPKTAIIFVD